MAHILSRPPFPLRQRMDYQGTARKIFITETHVASCANCRAPLFVSEGEAPGEHSADDCDRFTASQVLET